MTAEQDQLLCRYLDGRLSPEDKDALQELAAQQCRSTQKAAHARRGDRGHFQW